MNYLFVYNNAANIGGVQTLIARIAEGLIEAGHSVSVLFFSDISEAVSDFLPDECTCLSLPEKYRRHILFPYGCRRWLAHNCRDAEICVTFGKSAMHFVAANLKSFENRPTLICYVVNEIEFTRTGRKLFNRFYGQMFYDRYFERLLPDAGKFFVSEAVRLIHEEKLGTQFPDSRIMPLAIKAVHQPATVSLRPFRLVSIGRIDATMKTYNFTVPPVIRELRDEGCEIHWDVYGGGHPEETKKFMAVIRENGVEDCVAWHGELPYSEMGEVLENATAFLGMGTAVIEAAMLGIPAIVSVASTPKAVCYGFLHDVPFGVCGERGAYWLKRHSVKSILLQLYNCPKPEHDNLVTLERGCAMQYDLKRLVSRFIEFSGDAKGSGVSAFPISWSVFLGLNQLRLRAQAGR